MGHERIYGTLGVFENPKFADNPKEPSLLCHRSMDIQTLDRCFSSGSFRLLGEKEFDGLIRTIREEERLSELRNFLESNKTVPYREHPYFQ